MRRDVPRSIRDAYDPERFRADGRALIDAIADQLASWHRREGKVVPWVEPGAARERWHSMPGAPNLAEDLAAIARASTALAHPGCMGHQVPPPLPVAALAELVSAVLNNGMAVAEMGPSAVPIELAIVDWMCQRLGLPATAGGVLTSGGSLGNLTALLAMRQARAGFDVWSGGAHAGPALSVIVGKDSHYSIARAVRVMGWGDRGAIAARVDARHRLRPEAVEDALREAGDRRVVGIVASAGSTATGAIDPLDELADVAARHGLWLHVDAAHGGGLALSETHRDRLSGIELADSIVWDAHKMLMMPALVTAVLFRREPHAYAAFAQEASYLFEGAEPERTWWDLGQRTLECTKRMMAIELWCTLRALGESTFADIVDRQLELAAALAELVRASPDFELAVEPELNIVCFRHRQAGVTDPVRLDAHNADLRWRVVEDGRFYIVGTRLPSGYHLRTTLMNPLTEHGDLVALLERLRELCRG